MRRECFAVSALSVAAVMIASLAVAQEAAQPQLFVLHQEMARPGMMKQYEDTMKEFIALVRQHHDALPAVQFVGMAGEDFFYSYVTPIENYGALDKVHEGFAVMIPAVGEAKWNDLITRAGAATEFIRESIMLEYQHLSYAPAKPRLKPDEERYLHIDLHYVLPGRETESIAVAQETADLYRKKGVPDGYRLFHVQVGPEMPLVIVTKPARDAADFEDRERANRELLGAEGLALSQRAFTLLRRFESHSATLRPDLSLEPFKPKPSGK